MALLDSLVVFVVSLLVGGLGIYVGARVVADVDDFGHAVVTAFVGAVVWTVVGGLFGWVPLLGPLVTLLAYLAVVNWRYPGGWIDAGIVSLVAWLTAVVALYVLATVGLVGFEAFGVPGA